MTVKAQHKAFLQLLTTFISHSHTISDRILLCCNVSWSQQTVDNLKEMGILDHLTCLLRNLYAGKEATVRTGHGKTDWSKLGKEYVKAIYCHCAYLTYMYSTSCEMLGWMKHKLESRLPRETSISSDVQICGRKRIKTKEPLDESERGEWKSWLKAQHSEN